MKNDEKEYKPRPRTNKEIKQLVSEANTMEELEAIPELIDITEIIMDDSLTDREVLMLLVAGADDDDDEITDSATVFH
ncbi:MAG: hypothetical protein IBX50_18890 [Marinospirillum sp.]|uniref:hypothetical protein n=1 Tax=Marinospirillum sp. TaxID=2183934 RepID=UPI0019E0DB57|nr:hypothetical protein [Marinospirillum sp.]MBE0508756.1 hypothetical protein [Marinospirillum sp.]